MEADGRHTAPGGRESVSDDNVVRLPREWLGPREELVPVAVDDELVDHLATPPSTHDFWGEPLGDDWSLPDDEATSASRRHSSRRRGVTHARAITVTRFFRRSPNRTAPVAFSPPAAQALGASARGHRRGTIRVGLAVLLAVIGVAVSVASPSERSARSALTSRAAAAADVAAAPVAGTGVVAPGSMSRLRTRSSALRSRPFTPRTRSSARQAGRQRSAHQRAAHRRAARHVAPRTPSITIEPVRYAAPTPTAASSPTSAVPPVAPAVTPPAAAATRTSAGSHQPATGASGALGPGSSPDG